MQAIRKYVNDMVVGQKYKIIDNWNNKCEKRKLQLCFNGIYERIYYLRETTILVFLVDGHYRHINSYNEFYLIVPDFPKPLKTQIHRNVLMYSQSEKSLVFIRSIIRQKNLQIDGDFVRYMNEF
jgi:hypothetical protein